MYLGNKILEECTGSHKAALRVFKSVNFLFTHTYSNVISETANHTHLFNYVPSTVLHQTELFPSNDTVMDVKTVTVIRIQTVAFWFNTPCILMGGGGSKVQKKQKFYKNNHIFIPEYDYDK
jgi:hypothetical protein